MRQMNDLRLAVLIDADNVPYRSIKPIMQELTLYGTPTIKRIYGDWTNPSLSSWKISLLENAIIPIQQYGYTTRKNSTDSAMIIDAMDLLYSGKCDGFCIVSSDSDFTRLAMRLREAGMRVIGVGEKKTPNPFIVACDKFIYIEVIMAASKPAASAPEGAVIAPEAAPDKTTKKPGGRSGGKAAPAPQPAHSATNGTSAPAAAPVAVAAPAVTSPAAAPASPAPAPAAKTLPAEVVDLIVSSVSDLADEDGWAFLGEIGNLMIKKQPDFDPRNFGFSKLTPLISSLDRFDIEFRQTNVPNIKHVYLRDRERH